MSADPSIAELCVAAGIEEPRAEPGDLLPMDADLTAYWPDVRVCWEEGRG